MFHKERDALMSLIQGDSGKKWSEGVNGWNKTSHLSVCEWEGITCDDMEKVMTINLAEQGLKGRLSKKLGGLKSLHHLVLKENMFSGSIPHSIAKLPNLKVLILASNEITGTLPTIVSDTLAAIDVSHNHLTGDLFTSFQFSSPLLSRVDVSHNSFSGPIPEISPQAFKKLMFFDVGHNELTGTIPSDFGDFMHLEALFLNNNYLVGGIPQKLVRSNSKLVQLFMEDNMLSGTVPLGLADIRGLTDVFLDENNLTGEIPLDLCNEHLNEDYFTPPFDGPDRDGCTSIACPSDTTSDEGVYPCRPCANDRHTPYLGHAGDCYEKKPRKILTKFWSATGGPNWNGGTAYGWNRDDVPVCQWEGITCDQSQQNVVTEIRLPDMGLTGSLVGDVGYLTDLKVLDLRDNRMTGFLPSDLRFTDLEYLDVSGNQFRGAIPPLLCTQLDINSNGANAIDGLNLCERVVCPVGTFSVLGRGNETLSCTPCKGNRYLAMTTCPHHHLHFGATHDNADDASAALPLFITLLLLVGATMGYKSYKNHTEGIEYTVETSGLTNTPRGSTAKGTPAKRKKRKIKTETSFVFR